jgi:hypothetical protein
LRNFLPIRYCGFDLVVFRVLPESILKNFAWFVNVGLIWSLSKLCQDRLWRILPYSLLQVWL